MGRIPAYAMALSQVDLACCLDAMADPGHHLRQRDLLEEIRRALAPPVWARLTGVLGDVNWMGLILPPLDPEEWEPEVTGEIVAGRLACLDGARLISVLTGLALDEEDVGAVTTDPGLLGRLVTVGQRRVRRLAAVVGDPGAVREQVCRLLPVVWPVVFRRLRELTCVPVDAGPVDAADIAASCVELLGGPYPSIARIIVTRTPFAHPHGSVSRFDRDLLVIADAVDGRTRLRTLFAQGLVRASAIPHLREIGRRGLAQRIGTRWGLMATRSAVAMTWSQWLEEQVVAACQLEVLDRCGPPPGRERGFAGKLRRAMHGRSGIDPVELADMVSSV